jgi:hypothetical protein
MSLSITCGRSLSSADTLDALILDGYEGLVVQKFSFITEWMPRVRHLECPTPPSLVVPVVPLRPLVRVAVASLVNTEGSCILYEVVMQDLSSLK